MTDQLLPETLTFKRQDVERDVLTAMLADAKNVQTAIQTGVTLKHFTAPDNNEIATVIFQLVKDGIDADDFEIIERVRKTSRDPAKNLVDLLAEKAREMEVGTIGTTRVTEILIQQDSIEELNSESRRLRKAIEDGEIFKISESVDRIQNTITNFGGSASVLNVLERCRFDADNPPPPIDPVLMLKGIPICTPGNISVLVSHKKMGKSRVARAIARAVIEGGRHLGFTAAKGAVAYVDFEQSKQDFYGLLSDITQPTGRELLAYHLVGETIEVAKRAIEALAARTEIRVLLLDGWADLCIDVNDPQEANELVRWAMALSDRYKCVLLGILHLNPGSETKSRGHLGSQLERKAETVIQIERSKEGERIIYLAAVRHKPIDKSQGVPFDWDDDIGDFAELRGTPEDRAKQAQRPEMLALIEAVKDSTGVSGWRHTDLIAGIMEAERCSKPTAKRRLVLMADLGIIRKVGERGDWSAQ